MADDDDFQNDNDLDEGSQESSNSGRQYQRDLEKKNKRLEGENASAKAEAAEAQNIRKENLFLKAGVTNFDSGVGKLLFKGYEGELTVEAIKAAAAEVNLIPTSQRDDVAEELEDLASTRQVSQSSAGSGTPDAVTQIKQKGLSAQQIIDIAVKAGSTISSASPGPRMEL